LKKRPIVWQELFDLGFDLPPQTIVDVWKDWDVQAREQATKKGLHVIFSACWYLDHLADDWWKYYQCDPRAFHGTAEQKALIVGGHASMWGERVDETNFMARVWPRASAVAEKLWTGNVTNATTTALQRLQRFRCYLVRRGIAASPVAPGTCERHPYDQEDVGSSSSS